MSSRHALSFAAVILLPLHASAAETLWTEIAAAIRSELAESKPSVQNFLQQKSPAWHMVGRDHFNLHAPHPTFFPDGLEARIDREMGQAFRK